MKEIDRIRMERPTSGSRTIKSRLRARGHTVAISRYGVRISMDGKGRWLDNAYVERLWRSLKQEEVCRRAYETVAEAKKGIGDYLRYFNEERPRQGLETLRPMTYTTDESR